MLNRRGGLGRAGARQGRQGGKDQRGGRDGEEGLSRCEPGYDENCEYDETAGQR